MRWATATTPTTAATTTGMCSACMPRAIRFPCARAIVTVEQDSVRKERGAAAPLFDCRREFIRSRLSAVRGPNEVGPTNRVAQTPRLFLQHPFAVLNLHH